MLRTAPLAAAAAATGNPVPTPGDQEDLLSCHRPCHRALPHCPHFCLAPCHLGPCPHPEACQAEVTVRCECKRVRAKWACASVQAALAESRGGSGAYDGTMPLRLLPCGPECPTTLKQQQQQQVEQELQQQQEDQEQQHEGAQATSAQAAGRIAAAPGSTKQATAPSAVPKAAVGVGAAKKPKATADQSGSEASRNQEAAAATATAAAAAGPGAGAGTKGSRHMSKAEKQAAAEKVGAIAALVLLDVPLHATFSLALELYFRGIECCLDCAGFCWLYLY
eukprot:1136326-Pelagomonas_calceolata.AAC.1